MRPVRIVTYNVRYFGHRTRGLASTKKAMDKIATALAALSPLADIICLQEVETLSLRSNLAHPSPDGDTQIVRLLEKLDAAIGERGQYEAFYFPAHTYRFSITPIYTTGLAVFLNRDFKIASHNAADPFDITFRKITPVKKLKQTRICAHLRVVHKSGVDIDIFNTHFSLPTTLSREFWFEPKRMGWGPNQVEEAKNLVKFVDAQKKSERFVVVGDFNSLPGSPSYEILRAAFSDPFADYWHFDEDAMSDWPTAGFMNMRMHLDHVFAGRGLSFVDFDDSHRFGQKNGRFRGLSDHVPIIGAFTAK